MNMIIEKWWKEGFTHVLGDKWMESFLLIFMRQAQNESYFRDKRVKMSSRQVCSRTQYTFAHVSRHFLRLVHSWWTGACTADDSLSVGVFFRILGPFFNFWWIFKPFVLVHEWKGCVKGGVTQNVDMLSMDAEWLKDNFYILELLVSLKFKECKRF
jgi:hypothetical protein